MMSEKCNQSRYLSATNDKSVTKVGNMILWKADSCNRIVLDSRTKGGIVGSRKRSARKREIEAFKAEIDDDPGAREAIDGAFEQEANRQLNDTLRREQAQRAKACESKARYATRAEAQATIAACERHGSPALYIYRCPYCGGWHLTHKRPRK